MLQNSVQSGDSQLAQRLCGVTKVSGFVIDKESHDVILIGRVDPTLPALHLDDFVVALRNAKFIYGHKQGRKIFYTSPGCSIDPNPQVIGQLQHIETDGTSQDWVDKWNAIGSKAQNVRVMGVPFDTRFAKVMVDADYYMKRLVNGSVDLGIDGFQSLMGMQCAIARGELKSGGRAAQAETVMNRFWFCPGDCSYSEDGSVITLKRCQVKLLTEEEFLASSGSISGMGRSSVLGQRFADGFTAKYDEIAAARPIYKELQGLFRLYAIAKLMHDNNAESASGAGLRYLTNRYRLHSVPVARQLPGLTRTQALSNKVETEDGYSTSYLTLLSCGGVSMDCHPRRVASPRSKVRTIAAKATARNRIRQPLRAAVVSARKSKKALYWDYPVAD